MSQVKNRPKGTYTELFSYWIFLVWLPWTFLAILFALALQKGNPDAYRDAFIAFWTSPVTLALPILLSAFAFWQWLKGRASQRAKYGIGTPVTAITFMVQSHVAIRAEEAIVARGESLEGFLETTLQELAGSQPSDDDQLATTASEIPRVSGKQRVFLISKTILVLLFYCLFGGVVLLITMIACGGLSQALENL